MIFWPVNFPWISWNGVLKRSNFKLSTICQVFWFSVPNCVKKALLSLLKGNFDILFVETILTNICLCILDWSSNLRNGVLFNEILMLFEFCWNFRGTALRGLLLTNMCLYLVISPIGINYLAIFGLMVWTSMRMTKVSKRPLWKSLPFLSSNNIDFESFLALTFLWNNFLNFELNEFFLRLL